MSEDNLYQTFTGSVPNFSMYTETGRRIIFADYKHMTKDPEVIEYLEKEILAGAPGLIKGEPVTADIADPVAALKAKHYEEFKKQEAEAAKNAALGITRDMGNTENAGNDSARVKIPSSLQMAAKKVNVQAPEPKK